MNIQINAPLERKIVTKAFVMLSFLLIIRLIANYFIPLNDATEARYGEIARKMLETGNWVNLLHDYNIPFWAKPPLSTWMSALSMKWLGVNEFAARLPGLLLSIAVLALIGSVAKKRSGSLIAIVSVLILASTFYFFLDAGTVMTDPSLLFCTTLAMVSFWHALIYKSRLWSYVFFIGLGAGLLAKGPIAIVLVGMPLFFWVLVRNQWLNLWKCLPWFKGTLLLLAIALPWYILAEIRTPGFLNYFIIGEHFNRFMIPGWTGDKYGIAHHAPKGMIWLYALVGCFPWSILGCKWLLTGKKLVPSIFQDEDGWVIYWFFCMIVPLVFFTFASNIIYPYVFPSLPAFALFFAEIWSLSDSSLDTSKWIFKLPLVCGILFLIATVLFQIKPEWVAKTQKPVIEAWAKQKVSSQSHLIYWGDKTDFSAQFYSAGKVKAVHSAKVLCKLLSNHVDNYLVIHANAVNEIPSNLFFKLALVKIIMNKDKKLFLVHSPW